MDEPAKQRVVRAAVGAFIGAGLAALVAGLLAEPIFQWAFGSGGTTGGNGNVVEDVVVGAMTGFARFLFAALVVGVVLIPLIGGLPLLGAGLGLRAAPYVGRTILIGAGLLIGLSVLGGSVLGPLLGAGTFWAYPVGCAAALAGARAIVEHRWPPQAVGEGS